MGGVGGVGILRSAQNDGQEKLVAGEDGGLEFDELWLGQAAGAEDGHAG